MITNSSSLIQSVRSALAAALIFAAVSACQPAPQQQLKNTTIPAGFLFANNQKVKVSVSVSPSQLPASGVARLEIARADGKLIFRGQANGRTPLSIELGAPLKDKQLVATLYGKTGTPTQVILPIEGGIASGSF